MIFHEKCNIIPYFLRKLGKMSQKIAVCCSRDWHFKSFLKFDLSVFCFLKLVRSFFEKYCSVNSVKEIDGIFNSSPTSVVC